MLKPTSEAELADAIASANAPLAVRGSGTRGMTPDGLPLTTAGLSGVTLYEPGALTIVAQAGTPVTEIEAALSTDNQRLAFEPMDYRGLLGTEGEPTIGGVVAANVSGPRRVSVGACRDFALGVRYVDGAGEIIKNGGRVMKNVTGYDLVKLQSGARGTLGVLTEVSLKVLPTPETEITVSIANIDDAQAIQALSTALGSPFDVTGAAHMPSAGQTLVRVEGFEASVAYRAAQLTDLLKEFGEVSLIEGASSCSKTWADIRDVAPFHGTDGDVWRISVKPTDAPSLVAKMKTNEVIYDWGGGLIWALVPAGHDLRSALGVFQGHATLVRSNAETRSSLGMFQPEPAPLAAISAGLRARFDPRGVLNPGLMG